MNNTESPVPTTTASATNFTYVAEQYTQAAQTFTDSFESAANSENASAEYEAAKELISSIDALKTAVRARIASIQQSAKDQAMLAELKRMIENGAGMDEINAKMTEHHPVSKKRTANSSSRSQYPKAPKVFVYLASPEHNDLKWGYTGSLRNLDSSKTGQEWAKKLADGSADPAAFRKATEEETAEMQRRREAYIKDAEEECAAKKP